jgi:hypothetical protein
MVLFSFPMLAFPDSLVPLFGGLELFSLGSFGVAVIYFFVSPKSRDVVVCFLVNLAGAALNVYGFFFGLGTAIRAVS